MSYTLIALHLLVGSIAILSGFIATFMPKYARSHQYLGWTFFVSMLLLGISGSYIAYTRDIPLSLLNGLLLCYFALTSLQVIRQAPAKVSHLDLLYTGFGLGILIGFIYFGSIVIHSATGKLGGFSSTVYIAFGLLTLFAVLEDLYYLRRGGAKGKYRLTRHLWRMYMPLFMATAAFFLGQAKLFSEAIRTSGALFVPVLLILITWGYWLHRIQIRQKLPKATHAQGS